MRCRLCSSHGGEAHARELTFTQLCKVVDDATELGCRAFSLSGGEPLVHPRLLNLCRHIKQKKAALEVYTCGTVLEDKERRPTPVSLFRELEDIGVDKVVFSIHGGDRNTHDSLTTVAGSYDNLLASMDAASGAGLVTELHLVPTKKNYGQLSEIVALAHCAGTSKVSILRFVAQGRARNKRAEFDLSSQETQDLADSIRTLRKTSGIPIRVGAHYAELGLSEGAACTAATAKATMMPDGHLVPCPGLKEAWESNIGNNVVAKGLAAVWADSTVMNNARGIVAPAVAGPNEVNRSCPAQMIAHVTGERHEQSASGSTTEPAGVQAPSR